MQDRTIDNALLALRRQIIRGGGEGLGEVETLLEMRGVPLPTIVANKAGQRETQNAVRDALKDGPKTRREIVAHVAQALPDMPQDRAYWRTDAALAKLRRRGVVRAMARGVWGLVSAAKSSPETFGR